MKRLVRRERHPTDMAEADADVHRADRETDETDQRRAPCGAAVSPCRRTPRPAAVGRAEIPAPVMIGRPTPRLGADPRPAVRPFPGPAPVAIRCPADGDVVRHPDLTVGTVVGPIAVVPEVAAVDTDVRRRRLRERGEFLVVAIRIERVESVVRDFIAIGKVRIRCRALGDHRRPRPERLRALRRVDVGLPGAHGHERRSIIVDGDAIRTGRARKNRDGRCVDRVLPAAAVQQANVDRTRGQLYLTPVVGNVRHAQLHVLTEPNDVDVVELDFGARLRAGRHVIAGEERRVDHRADGGVRVAVSDADVTLD